MMTKIPLSSIPAELRRCLEIGVERVWDYLPRESQIHELEEARKNLEWQQGEGRSWCVYMRTVEATDSAVSRHLMKLLFGRVLMASEIIEYLCAEHGLTYEEAGGWTRHKFQDLMRREIQARGLSSKTRTSARGNEPPADSAPPLVGQKNHAPGGRHVVPGNEDEAPVVPAWVGEHFQRLQYKLVRRLWGQGEVAIADVSQALYSSRTGKEEALDKVKDRANGKLAEISQPYEIITRRNEVYVLRPVADAGTIHRRP